MLRCPYFDMYQLVTFLIAVHSRKAFAFQAEDLTALRSRWYFDLRPAVNSGHFELRTENGVREGDVQFVNGVQAFALQFFVRFFFNQDDKVARGTAAFAG